MKHHNFVKIIIDIMQTQKQQQQQQSIQRQQQEHINYDQQGIDNEPSRQIDSPQQQHQQRKQSIQRQDDTLIPHPRFRQESKYMTSHTHQNSRKKNNKNTNPIVNQNEELKMKNEALKKELFKFSKRLDAQLSKRSQKAQMKNQLLSNMELQNAYRRCEIYKKQLSIYKKRDLSYSEDRYNQIKGSLIEKTKQNEQLKNQVKQLKKIGKFQEKSLIELGNSGYMAIVSENQRLKNQNMKMKIKLQQNQRNNRLVPLAEKNDKYKRQQKEEESFKHATQQQQKQQKQLALLKSTHQKDSTKLRQLTFEKNRQQEIIANLTAKLQQKDKQIQGLKGTVINLRKLNKQSTKQKRYHTETSIQANESHLNTSNSKKSRFIIKKEMKRTNNKKDHQSSVMSIQENIHEKQNLDEQQQMKNDGVFLTENNENIESQRQRHQRTHFKYPRIEQYGNKRINSQQWNDHAFSSKMKEIQILPHQNGHIKDIHIRYQNGEPNKKQGQYSSFICQQFNQYITHISGGFQDEILQFLVIETNQKRTNKFCRYDIEGECQNFAFKLSQNEYPSALFGEKTNQGIVRLGCFIQKLDKK